MKEIRVGLIGCGNIGGFHCRVLEEVENAKLVAVADPNAALTSALEQKYGCRAFGDYKDMLAWGEVDLVSVCLPPALHFEAVEAAAKAGIHVLVEKPLDVSPQSADRMIAVCQNAGVKLGAVSQHRFDPAIRALSDLINRGALGRLMMGTVHVIWYRDPAYYETGGGWRGLKANQGGVLMSQATHYIDLLQYLMGGVDSVSAVCETLLHNIEAEDTGLALLRFKNGAIGSIEATTMAYPGLMAELNIYAENATICVRNDSLAFYESKTGKIAELDALLAQKREVEAAVADPLALDTAGHRAQYLDMISAIFEDRDPVLDGAQGRQPLALIDAIHRASEQGTWIKVD
ncbi:MAG: Gfo/Idh/MocA family oxidoreductase [Oscillospiraceae bacterium]|jgi:predicted dehydrogenase|nr:Gfo/Idh/MocA family oxidoreductase [Oscillospiraceae bacterium]